MANSTIVAKPIALLSSLLSLLVAPTPFDSTAGVVGTDVVCASGTCCQQVGATCNAGGPTHTDFYFKSEGMCPS